MKKAKLEKSPFVKVKESEEGSWYNQSDFLSNPSSSKDIGASRIKITASAPEKFEDEKSDSGESNISSESKIDMMPGTIQPLSPLLTG